MTSKQTKPQPFMAPFTPTPAHRAVSSTSSPVPSLEIKEVVVPPKKGKTEDDEQSYLLVLNHGEDGLETVVCNPSKFQVFGPGQLRAAFGFMGMNSRKTFRLRLTREATLTTGGGGTMNLATSVQPSQFDQYAQLQSLFRECRLVSTGIEYISLIQPGNSTVLPAAFVVGFDPSAAVTPTFTNASRLQNSRTFTSAQTNWPVRNKYVNNLKSMWSNVTASSGATDPLTAIFGSWMHCLNGTGSASQTYLQYLIVAEYDFRNLI